MRISLNLNPKYILKKSKLPRLAKSAEANHLSANFTKPSAFIDNIKFNTQKTINYIKNFTTEILQTRKCKKIFKQIEIEYSQRRSNNFKKVKTQINPINEKNIDEIKTKLAELNKFYKTSLSDEALKLLLAENDPYNLFTLLTSPKMYKSLNSNEDIMDWLATKSKDKEIRETELRIKKKFKLKQVILADDRESANIIEAGLEKIINRTNIRMPKNIVVSPYISDEFLAGYSQNIFKNNDETIYLAMSPITAHNINLESQKLFFIRQTNKYKNATTGEKKIIEKLMLSEQVNPLLNRPDSNFLHEIGHSFQIEKNVSRSELKTAKAISTYASQDKSGDEIVPEFFAYIMNGGKLTEKQMKLYKRLGGIIPNNYGA